jgi:hypothetical protein
VTGHVDLGHDRDVPGGRVPDQVPVVGLGQVAGTGAVDAGAGSAADRGQPRPAVDLDPPALVVRQVQVQMIDLEPADLVDVRLDLVRRVEVPRDVQHRPAVCEPRIVNDAAAGHAPRPAYRGPGLDLRGQQLPQGLRPGEEPGRLVGPDGDAAAVDAEPVALVPELRVSGAEEQRDGRQDARGGGQNRQRIAGRRAQCAGELITDGPGSGRTGLRADHGERAEPEVRAGDGPHLDGRGDDTAERRYRACRRSGRGGGGQGGSGQPESCDDEHAGHDRSGHEPDATFELVDL